MIFFNSMTLFNFPIKKLGSTVRIFHLYQEEEKKRDDH